jgi:hypothetical protein
MRRRVLTPPCANTRPAPTTHARRPQQNAGAVHKGKFSRLTFVYSNSGRANSFHVRAAMCCCGVWCVAVVWCCVGVVLCWCAGARVVPCRGVGASTHRRRHPPPALRVTCTSPPLLVCAVRAAPTTRTFAAAARRRCVRACRRPRTRCTTRISSETSAPATHCTRPSRCARARVRVCVCVGRDKCWWLAVPLALEPAWRRAPCACRAWRARRGRAHSRTVFAAAQRPSCACATRIAPLTPRSSLLLRLTRCHTQTQVELKLRYPMMGGWKTDFMLGE